MAPDKLVGLMVCCALVSSAQAVRTETEMESLTNDTSQCKDKPHWTNGDRNCNGRFYCSEGQGDTCLTYQTHGWCTWGHKTGKQYNYPEKNCCVCGGSFVLKPEKVKVCIAKLFSCEGKTGYKEEYSYHEGYSTTSGMESSMVIAVSTEAQAEYSSGAFTGSASIAASVESMSSSAFSQTKESKTARTVEMNCHDHPAYVYQSQVTMFMNDDSVVVLQGAKEVYREPLALSNSCVRYSKDAPLRPLVPQVPAPVTTSSGRLVTLTHSPSFGLTVKDGVIVNDAPIILYGHGATAQWNNGWTMQANGQIVLTNNPSFALTVKYGVIKNNAEIIIYEGGAQWNNKWTMQPNGQIVLTESPHFALTVKYGVAQNNAEIIIHEGSAQWNNQWAF